MQTDERLTEAGYKMTRPRRRVLAALEQAHEPWTAQEVAARAGTGVASTYRVLALLVDLGVVSDVPPPPRSWRAPLPWSAPSSSQW
ncbi:MAG: Fur family transcriptional regulator [Ktedonobacterales bacterium]